MTRPGLPGRKFGYNAGVSTVEVEIRSEDVNLDYQITAQALELVSSSAADAAAGTGAQVVIVQGLDGDFHEVSEIVVPDGITPVALSKSYIRMLRAYVDDVGSGGVNAGAISIQLAGAGALQAQIPAGEGQTQLTNFTAQGAKHLDISQIEISVASTSNQSVVVLIKVWHRKQHGKSWRMIGSKGLSNGSGFIPLKDEEAIFPPKTDIKITAQKLTGTGDARVEAAYSYSLY